MGGIIPFPSPSPEAFGEDDTNDEDDDANSYSNDEMTGSHWLSLCHSWQKGGVVLG